MQADKDQYKPIILNKNHKKIVQHQETETRMPRQAWMSHRQRPEAMNRMMAYSEHRRRKERCPKQEIVTEAVSSKQLPPRRRVIAYRRRNCTPPHLLQNLKPTLKFKSKTGQAQGQSKDRATG